MRTALLAMSSAVVAATAGCLAPVVEGPSNPELPDGGLAEVACGDGGIYGIAYDGARIRDGSLKQPVYFDGCTRIVGRLKIGAERSLEPYRKVRQVERELDLSYLVETRTLEPLSNLIQTGGFIIQRLPVLPNLSGLENVREVTQPSTIAIFQNDSLVSLSTLKATRFLGSGILTISDNSKLENLDGLEGIASVKSLTITGNRSLTNLSGLSSLQAIEGDVDFYLNPLLPRAEIDKLLARVRVGGAVRIAP
jgi:hypothetical protein